MKQVKYLFALTTIGALATASVQADSISPDSVSAMLDVGESMTITKTVTVDAGTPTSSKVDVFFLADETGSMGGQIAAVKSAAASILSTTAGLGDVAFGVGGYRDITDTFTYRQIRDLTTIQATAQAGVNTWAAGGGGDWYEANMFALEEVATGTSWRPGSERILVWFGDAPGHDPRAGSTEASATTALVANGVQVQALDVRDLDYSGQATRITTATGGALYTGVTTSGIVTTIQDAITTAIEEYSAVGLDLSEVPSGITASASPDYAGDFDRTSEEEFTFDLTFTADAAGVYDFNVYGTVDGGRVATEIDRISVRSGGPTVPDGGASAVMLGIGLLSLGFVRRQMKS